MALLLKGAPVAKAINERAQEKVKRLTGTGIEPALAILRVGERADDLSYEKGAVKRCEQIGVKVVKKVLPADIDEESFFKELEELKTQNNTLFFDNSNLGKENRELREENAVLKTKLNKKK